jgi:hypothetical protein
METMIGFAVGYFVGTREGRAGFEKARASLAAIRHSEELRRMAGMAVAGGNAHDQATGQRWRGCDGRRCGRGTDQEGGGSGVQPHSRLTRRDGWSAAS